MTSTNKAINGNSHDIATPIRSMSTSMLLVKNLAMIIVKYHIVSGMCYKGFVSYQYNVKESLLSQDWQYQVILQDNE